jgi:hypothetical protein
MAQRSPGRPKASEPREVKVSLRFTEHEADVLCRLAGGGSLSAAIRKAIERYVSSLGGWRTLPDTESALIRRELRKAKRLASPEAEALEQVFALEEPPAPHSAQLTTIQVVNQATGRTGTLTVTNLPDPNAGKPITVQARVLPAMPDPTPPGR